MEFLDAITKYWTVILFVAGIIFQASWAYSKIKEHDEEIKALKEGSEKINDILIDIRGDLREIKAVLKMTASIEITS